MSLGGAGLSRGRRWVSGSGWRLTPADTAYDASLVLGELVSNALRHAVPLGDGNLVLSWGAFDEPDRVGRPPGGRLRGLSRGAGGIRP